MNRLAAIALLFAPLVVTAQSVDLVGKRIRAKLGGASGPWAEGFVVETRGDSLTMRLADNRTDIVLSTADVTVERSDGHSNGRGLARGAIIGGLLTIAVMAATPEFSGEGLEGLYYLIFPPVGAAVGGAVGVAAAPERWTPISSGRLSCGGWRSLNPGAAGAPIVVRGPRDRRRGALLWGLALGGIGLVGGLTDSELPRQDVPGVVIGNVAFGAVIGAFWGPRQKLQIQTTCPAP